MEKTTFIKKSALGIAGGLVIGFVFFRISSKYLGQWLPLHLIWALSVLLLFSGPAAVLSWHWKERKNMESAVKATLEHVIIYLLALDLSLFGWQKILHLQMIVPLGVMDLPFNSLGGENLMWAFFKWSYPFTIVIALTQLISAALLLFARTRLLALVMIIPILVNIACLDYFYEMPVWVLLHALVLLSGVIYLISLDSEKLVALFFSRMQGVGKLNIRKNIKHLIRLSILVIPVIFFSTYNFPDKNPALTGKYKVEDLKVNGYLQKAVSPKDSVLTTVYMDLENDFVLEFNDYRYRYIGTYRYISQTGSIVVKWRYPNDTIPLFSGKLIRDKNKLFLKGQMGKETLSMKLIRPDN